jgi:large subunit ribosomal protein L5
MSVIQLNTNKYFEDAYTQVASELPKVNTFALPKLSKVSLNVGVGRFDPKQKLEIADYLAKLTGQLPKHIGAKKAVANFKTRKNDLVGLVVTLRGKKAQDFLINLIYIALPRTRDFKGIKADSYDKNFASYSLGIENSSIFPIVGFDSSIVFGMQINVVFSNPDSNNKILLDKLNFPFKKN